MLLTKKPRNLIESELRKLNEKMTKHEIETRKVFFCKKKQFEESTKGLYKHLYSNNEYFNKDVFLFLYEKNKELEVNECFGKNWSESFIEPRIAIAAVII